MNEIVQILPFGGQDELGKNMIVININDHLFILDVGYRIPESEKLGVDVIIPSFDYLIENEDLIEGIFITHGHNDSMAGLPYLLRELDIPVYASDLTCDLIEEVIGHYNRKTKLNIIPDLRRIHKDEILEVGGVKIKAFPLTHSIPGTIGYAFLTTHGYIVHLGEFMIDFGAPKYFKTDIQAMMEIGKEGVLALLLESNYAMRTGYTAPSHKIYDLLKPVFEESAGRIIIASYAQNVFRMKEIFDLANNYNKKIAVYSKNKYDNTIAVMRAIENRDQPIIDYKDVLINVADLDQYQDAVILLTGDPTRLYRDIDDIIQGDDNYLSIKETDTIIIACQNVPGTEKIAAKVIDELYRTDAKIVSLKNANTTSMHASAEDIKVAIEIFEPKYVFPIRGEFQHLTACEDIANTMNIPRENVVIVDNGEVRTIKDGLLDPHIKLYEMQDIMIDGIGIGDVGEKVIDDRIQLSHDGVVVIGITVNRKHEIVTFTDVQTRGFVYLKDSEYLVKEIIKISEDTVAEFAENYYFDTNDIRMEIKDRVNRHIFKSTGKRPMVLPAVIELQD